MFRFGNLDKLSGSHPGAVVVVVAGEGGIKFRYKVRDNPKTDLKLKT